MALGSQFVIIFLMRLFVINFVSWILGLIIGVMFVESAPDFAPYLGAGCYVLLLVLNKERILKEEEPYAHD